MSRPQPPPRLPGAVIQPSPNNYIPAHTLFVRAGGRHPYLTKPLRTMNRAAAGMGALRVTLEGRARVIHVHLPEGGRARLNALAGNNTQGFINVVLVLPDGRRYSGDDVVPSNYWIKG